MLLTLVECTPVGCDRHNLAVTPSNRDIETIAEDLMTVGEMYRSPEPSPSDSSVVFLRSAAGGRSLFRVTPERTEQLKPEGTLGVLFRWSPQGQRLLLKSLFTNSVQLQFYLPDLNAFQPALAMQTNAIGSLAWLDEQHFAFTTITGDGAAAEVRLTTLGGLAKVLRRFPTPGTMDYMVPISAHQIAYLENREICTLDVYSGEFRQITTNASKQFIWLEYSPERRSFLFCSEDESDWRHLFSYSLEPAEVDRMRQLTFGPEHTYNGQWIQKGKGFAYIGNDTNHFYLAVRPENPLLRTNLFAMGHVLAYRPSSDGQAIFAAAAVEQEPAGIWRYEIDSRVLTQIFPGADRKFSKAESVRSIERRAKSFDGLAVPYFVSFPKGFEQSKKFPVIIAIPPEAGQFVQAWEKYAQFFANIGVIYVAVNPRGSDGYGLTYRKLPAEDAYRDVLAVRDEILKEAGADSSRMFLLTYSNGSYDANKLAHKFTEYWDGVIVISGSVPQFPEAGPLPRYFVFMGEQDKPGLVQRARQFKKWAEANHASVTVLFDKDTEHHITNTDVDRLLAIELASFIYHRK